MKKELLSPAGNMESLYQAVQNGCDAIYLSGKSFGARKFASNFTRDELVDAIRYCHLYGVRIYVTVNTLVHDSETEELFDYVRFLYENGVDALIMQDLGMIRTIREMYPNLEIHASTQLHNHNKEDLKLLKKLGVRRAVLARELSIDEIKKLDSDIELEVFIHGALCISYSGQCLFSSVVLNRSGNRGECAGFCRLPYDLIEDSKKVSLPNKYLLSPRELNTVENLHELLSLDSVTSLKIEGRMKSPEYVGFVTALYREAIDSYECGKSFHLSEERKKQLLVLYNRGFTKGHLFHDSKENLMNPKSPNHAGILLGQVVEVANKRIKIRLVEDLNQGDGIRFSNGEGMIANFIYNQKDLLVSSIKKGEVAILDNKVGLTTLGMVQKTTDKNFIDSLKLVNKRKIGISGKLIARPGERLSLELTDGENLVQKLGDIVEWAKTSPTDETRIFSQIAKLKETPFQMDYLEIVARDVFIPIKELNELRREAVFELMEKRMESKRDGLPHESKITPLEQQEKKITVSVLVRNKEQLDVAKNMGVDRIYLTDEKLYEQEKSENIFLKTKKVVSHYKERKNENLLISEVGGILFYQGNKMITDYSCNAYNHKTVAFFHEMGVDTVTLSVELSSHEIEEVMQSYQEEYNMMPRVEVFIYGRRELMTMKHCIISTILNQKKACSLCKTHQYFLEDRNKERYPIQTDCPITYLFESKPLNLISEIEKLNQAGVSSFRIELFNENREEVKKILGKVFEKCR